MSGTTSITPATQHGGKLKDILCSRSNAVTHFSSPTADSLFTGSNSVPTPEAHPGRALQ